MPILEVSDLPGDRSQLYRSQMVNDIRRAAEQPGICSSLASCGRLKPFRLDVPRREASSLTSMRCSMASTTLAQPRKHVGMIDSVCGRVLG